jgi:hypothetical protein
MFPPVQDTAEPEVEKATEPEVKNATDPEVKNAAGPENTSGEFQSSDIGSKNAPGHLPTEDQKKRVQEQQQKNCEAPEPSYEAAVTNPLSPESTNLNASSTTKEQCDLETIQPQSNDQEGAGGRPGGEGGRTGIQAGDDRAKTVNTADSEASSARKLKSGSEEVLKRGDTIEPLHEGWQDIGATSGILRSRLEDEASSGIREGEVENGKAEGEKDASALPLLSKNNETHEDIQCRIAEEKERRLAAKTAEAATNRLGKDW